MLSSSKIRIAQLQLQLLEASALRMYKASWLKNVDEVARDQGGKFASKAGGAIATANLPDAKAIQKAGLTPVINSDGSGTSLFATTTIDGKQFFLKEVQAKRTISSGRRSWEVKSPYGAEREEIGGDVARLLGLGNHVIPTKKIELDGKKYTVAPFTAGDPFWDVHFHDVSLPKKAKLIEDKLGPRAKQAILLDFLLDNRDRHAGNTYITKDGGLKLIDHEFILSKRKEGDKTSPLKGVMKDYVQGKHQAGSPVEFAEAELQDAIGKRADIVKLIKKRLPADEAKEAIEVLDGRIDYLKTMINNKEFGAYQMTFSADELKMMQEGTGVIPNWANSPASATQPMNAPASATQPMNAPASATRPISETGSLGTAPISVISRKPRRIPSMSETAPMSSNATATL